MVPVRIERLEAANAREGIKTELRVSPPGAATRHSALEAANAREGIKTEELWADGHIVGP